MSFLNDTSTTHTLADPTDTILTLKNPNAPLGLSNCDEGESNASWLSTLDLPSGRMVRDDNTPPSPTPSPVIFQLSSQHLIQASSIFKAALNGGWKEGCVTENGYHEISAEDWDAEAMRIVLSLIHSRTRDIPRTVSLEMLVKIAIIVDYYELHEAICFSTSLWIDTLRDSVPTVYNGDVMSWICISWVFKDASIFETTTKLAIAQSPGKVPTTTNLPIPEKVLSRINWKREGMLSEISVLLHSVKNRLLDQTQYITCCSFECRCLHLGALIKYMHDNEVPESGVMKTAKERSLEFIIQHVRDMKSPSPTWHPHPPYGRASLNTLTEHHLRKVVGNIQGLGLQD